MRRAAAALDHLVLATPDLDVTARWIEERTGVSASPGGQHPGRGTRNVLYRLGGKRYLEIIGPDPEQATPSAPRPFGIDRLANPTLVAWAVAVPDMEAAVRSARQRGFDPGPYDVMERRRPDGVLLRWRLTLPIATTIPFLIDWGDSRHPAGDAAAGLRLTTFSARDPGPDSVRDKLAAMGLTMTIEAGTEALVMTLRGPHGSVAFA